MREVEPQCRQPGATDLAAHPGGLHSLTQPSLTLQNGTLLPPQCAPWPSPCLPGRAVGESNLSPDWLATCCQPGQGHLYSLLGLAKGAPGSPKCWRGFSQSGNPNQDSDQVQPLRLVTTWPVPKIPRVYTGAGGWVGGVLGPEAKRSDSPSGKAWAPRALPPLCSPAGPRVAAAGHAGEAPPALAPLWTWQARAAQVGALAWSPPLRGCLKASSGLRDTPFSLTLGFSPSPLRSPALVRDPQREGEGPTQVHLLLFQTLRTQSPTGPAPGHTSSAGLWSAQAMTMPCHHDQHFS